MMRRWGVLGVCAGLIAGCGGASTDDAVPVGGADAAPSGGAGGAAAGGAGGDSSGGGGGASACDVVEPRPACPEPGADTFGVAPAGFANAPADFATAQPQIRHRAADILANTLDDTPLTGRMARGRGLSSLPYTGEAVQVFTWSATGAWASVGEATTDANGLFSLARPAGLAWGAGSHDYYAVLAGDASCARGGVFLWPAGTPIVITDIDGTLTTSDAELLQQISDPTHDPAMYAEADALMRDWVAKGYRVVYLTARPHEYRAMTDAWLVAHDFPRGPIITADSLVLGSAARAYKAEAIGHLMNDLGWHIEVAYGNATSDISAYADNALPLERTFIIGEFAGTEGTTAVDPSGYAAHRTAFVEPYAAVAEPLADAPFCGL